MKYAYSIKTTKVKEPDFPYPNTPLGCTSEVLNFVKSLQDSDVEKMILLYLDAQNKLICIQIVTGVVNQCVVYPREVLRHALLVNASAMIMVHNHPSGNRTPSDADIRLTKLIQEAAKILDVILHDHLIVAADQGYFSMREEGLVF